MIILLLLQVKLGDGFSGFSLSGKGLEQYTTLPDFAKTLGISIDGPSTVSIEERELDE